MPTWIALAILLGLFVFIGWRIDKARQVFVLIVESGRVIRVKGRIPTGLLGDVEDVLRGSSSRGRVTALPEGDRARLDFRGAFPAEIQQRLRNVVGSFPLARIRSASFR